jgi:hypothetical protein
MNALLPGGVTVQNGTKETGHSSVTLCSVAVCAYPENFMEGIFIRCETLNTQKKIFLILEESPFPI